MIEFCKDKYSDIKGAIGKGIKTNDDLKVEIITNDIDTVITGNLSILKGKSLKTFLVDNNDEFIEITDAVITSGGMYGVQKEYIMVRIDSISVICPDESVQDV